MLPIAMVTGASLYLIYHILPEPVHHAGPVLTEIVSVLQPLLIFSMLFLTFCRIEPKDLKPHRWHWWLLLIQGGLFTLLGFVVVGIRYIWPEAAVVVDGDMTSTKIAEILIECAMLCLICPTATAAAVVTRKLGGDVPGITTYIVLINLLTAVLVPAIVPMVHPQNGVDFWTAFNMIMAKVFPLLISPCLCAWLVRYLFPRLHRWLLRYPDLPFYIWSVALTLAIALTTKAIVHTDMSAGMLLAMSGVSLVCCLVNFTWGRHIGAAYRTRVIRRAQIIAAGQSLGQKNTIFLIWLAYTFMTPETAIIGGLYSIWHNIYNSRQLRRAGRE
jgi:BASS family bile acid:Na+ symporter